MTEFTYWHAARASWRAFRMVRRMRQKQRARRAREKLAFMRLLEIGGGVMETQK